MSTDHLTPEDARATETLTAEEALTVGEARAIYRGAIAEVEARSGDTVTCLVCHGIGWRLVRHERECAWLKLRRLAGEGEG